MKQGAIFTLLAAALLLASCEKDPDTDKLDNNYLVYTSYDKGTDFRSMDTYHIIDSILIISNQTTPTYWRNENSATIISAFNSNLEAAGYTPVASSDEANMVLQLSYVSTTYYFNSYGNGPWWNNYPGYWNWGGWGWYYPFSFVYTYSTGSIIAELVSTTPSAVSSDKLTVMWNAYITGLLNGSSLSMSRTLNAIEQAFDQSPYLSK